MKTYLDPRRIRLGIEVSGALKWYEGFNIKATGTKYANPTQNDCNATIIGIDMASRDYILTETSPFNANRTPKRLILEVGTVELGTFQLFVGDIFSAEPMSPPDVGLTIKANTQGAAMGKMVAKSGGESSKLSALAKSVADDLGLNLVFEATDKDVGNYQHTDFASADSLLDSPSGLALRLAGRSSGMRASTSRRQAPSTRTPPRTTAMPQSSALTWRAATTS